MTGLNGWRMMVSRSMYVCAAAIYMLSHDRACVVTTRLIEAPMHSLRRRHRQHARVRSITQVLQQSSANDRVNVTSRCSIMGSVCPSRLVVRQTKHVGANRRIVILFGWTGPTACNPFGILSQAFRLFSCPPLSDCQQGNLLRELVRYRAVATTGTRTRFVRATLLRA